MNLKKLFHALRRNRSGLAMTEFALGAPFLLGAGLWGIETANFAVTNMKVGQLAVHVADNASRIGDTTTLMNRKLFEEDINDLLLGANIQAGEKLDLYEHGRMIISSVEVWDDTIDCSDGACVGGMKDAGDIFVRWQRCKGTLAKISNYGVQGDELSDGIGPDGEEVSPAVGAPVIFVEIFYDYQPLIDLPWLTETQIKSHSAFMVRDKRDMSKVYKRNAATVKSNCGTYNSFVST